MRRRPLAGVLAAFLLVVAAGSDRAMGEEVPPPHVVGSAADRAMGEEGSGKKGERRPKLTQQQAEQLGSQAAEIQKVIEKFGEKIENLAAVLDSPEFKEQISSNPEFLQTLILYAALQRQGSGLSADQAQEQVSRGLRGRVRQSWHYRDLGDYAWKRKDYRTALSDYEEAVRLDRADRNALLGYGFSALELGDSALAGRAAAQLLARDPKDEDAHALRSAAAARPPTVRLPSAVFQSQAATESVLESMAGPTAVIGALPAGVQPPSATPEQAAVAARTAESRLGSVARSAQLTREAGAALNVHDYPGAHGLASRAVALNARNAQALNHRGMAAYGMGRFAEAVADADASLALAPGSVAALNTRSRALARQGLFREALRDADAMIERSPSAFAHENRARALAGLGDRQGVLEALRRSAGLDERFAPLLERALQLPQDQDMTLLFEESAAPAAPASPGRRRQRFLRLALLSAAGGLLIALGTLHIVSAGWRQTVRVTIRRVFGGAGPRSAAPEGTFWTQYELVRMIGLGGMGVVYEALDRSLERHVAVKKMRGEIRLDPGERRHFIQEAKLVAQLHHPHIVDIYGIVEEGSDIYLVFEFVAGCSLADRLKRDGPMSLEQARPVLRAAAEAVAHSHARGIVHRDLKPSNIMLSQDGTVKVMDFGVARQAKDALSKLTMTNTVVGTPAYMAPEQEQGSVRRESDVYALGVCLYEMLTGQLPFSGSPGAMLVAKQAGKHAPASARRPGLPAALDAVIAKALSPDPESRYRGALELADAVDAAVAARA